jgi:hypothetical protein
VRKSFLDPASAAEAYRRDGFAILSAYDEAQVETLEALAEEWLYGLLETAAGRPLADHRLADYHRWYSGFGIDHGRVFRAANRHRAVDPELLSLLLNPRVTAFLEAIGLRDYRLWDEGLGALAFRFIRPGVGDGYPFSRKEWGPAGTVVSCWIPVIGRSPRETLSLVPGSHLREYEKHLPDHQRHRADEYRLQQDPATLDTFNPALEPGDAVFYHPRTIHSEEVADSSITRLNLEFRVHPITERRS